MIGGFGIVGHPLRPDRRADRSTARAGPHRSSPTMPGAGEDRHREGCCAEGQRRQGRLLLPPHPRLDLVRAALRSQAKSRWRSCRRGRWPSASVPRAPGLGGFLTPTGYGTRLAEGKETRVIDGRGYVLEMPLRADIALIRAERGGSVGQPDGSTRPRRNFNPVMAMGGQARHRGGARACRTSLSTPSSVVTPGIFIQSGHPIRRCGHESDCDDAGTRRARRAGHSRRLLRQSRHRQADPRLGARARGARS